MPGEGYLQVRAYTSDALLPLEGTAISALDTNGNLLAARLTDKSGRIKPIRVEVPVAADSRNPDYEGQPFTTVVVRAQHPQYEQIRVNQVQIFDGITTMQPLEMVPIPIYPSQLDRTEVFDVPPQNL